MKYLAAGLLMATAIAAGTMMAPAHTNRGWAPETDISLRVRVKGVWPVSNYVEVAKPMSVTAIYTEFQNMKGH